MSFSGVAHFGDPITGKPYSAQQVSERTQTLGDGTHIADKPSTAQMYRDSRGRTRTERPVLIGPSARADVPIVIEIRDPVAECQYTLDTANHIAYRVVATQRTNAAAGGQERVAVQGVPHVSAMPATSNMTAFQTAESAKRVPASNSEDLGTQTMEGVLVQGQRQTTVIPAGAQGNDAPMTVVHETWSSPQLSLMVLSKTSDPRTGERVTRLTNIVVGDPDPALFQPPGEYQIVDKSDTFQIRFSVPSQQ